MATNGVENRQAQQALLNGHDTKLDAEIQITKDQDLFTKVIGALGKWQLVICAFIFLVKFPVAWHQMSIIFLAPPTNFTCTDPISEHNETNDFDSVCQSSCSAYEYDRSIFTETIITQWNLICANKWLKDFTQTIFMFGILVGSMVFGHLADRYGRRVPFLAAVFLQLISGVATAFAPDYITFTSLRFLLAVATGGTMTTSFVIIMELIGAEYREVVGILYQVPFNMAALSLPGIAYFLRNWSTFQLAISVPSVFFLSYYFILPESPRWLITVGRNDEAVKIMEKAAKTNGLPSQDIAASVQKISVSMSITKPEQHASFFDLFRTPNLRMKTICMGFNWLVCGLCFFGVSQYAGQAAGNIFANAAFSSALQLPGTIIAIYFLKVIGRKRTLMYSNCLAGLSCLVISFVPAHLTWLRVTMASFGIMCLATAFATIYLYAGELFPTVVRNIGLGFSSTMARIGSMAAPFIAGLGSVQHWLPPVIFGLMPLVAAVLCIFLPETKGRKLPDTLEDGERKDSASN